MVIRLLKKKKPRPLRPRPNRSPKSGEFVTNGNRKAEQKSPIQTPTVGQPKPQNRKRRDRAQIVKKESLKRSNQINPSDKPELLVGNKPVEGNEGDVVVNKKKSRLRGHVRASAAFKFAPDVNMDFMMTLKVGARKLAQRLITEQEIALDIEELDSLPSEQQVLVEKQLRSKINTLKIRKNHSRQTILDGSLFNANSESKDKSDQESLSINESSFEENVSTTEKEKDIDSSDLDIPDDIHRPTKITSDSEQFEAKLVTTIRKFREIPDDSTSDSEDATDDEIVGDQSDEVSIQIKDDLTDHSSNHGDDAVQAVVKNVLHGEMNQLSQYLGTMKSMHPAERKQSSRKLMMMLSSEEQM